MGCGGRRHHTGALEPLSSRACRIAACESDWREGPARAGTNEHLTRSRLAEEHFRGEGGALLLAGNALHADLSPETAGSGLFGWMMCALAQTVGFPVPEGGAGSLTAALVTRFERAGGQLRCGERVEQVVVRNGRSVGVRTAGGEEVLARHAVLADVDAPQLYRDLLSETPLPRHLTGKILTDFSGTPAPSRLIGRSSTPSRGLHPMLGSPAQCIWLTVSII